MSETRIDASANTRVDASGNTRITRSGAIFSDATLELLDASVGAGHRDGSAQVVYVLKATPLSLVTRANEDLYFASTTYRTGATDTPANTAMLGRLTPPNVRVSILKGNEIGRATSTARGQIKISNPQESHFDRNSLLTKGRGRYDGLRRDYSWQNRSGQMYIGPEDGLFGTDFDPFFPCLVTDFDWTEDALLLVPGAALVEADKDVQKNFYGQGYTLITYAPSETGGGKIDDGPAGIGGGGGGTGDAGGTITSFDDLSNVPMPLAYGRVLGVPAQEISRINEIHQWHTTNVSVDGSIVQSLDKVYEDGLEFTAGADYDENLGNATFTLSEPSTAIITCDGHGALAGPSGTYIDRPAAIIRAVMLNNLGLAVSDIATETLDLYDAHFDYECGFYFGSNAISRDQFIERMLAPLGFAYRSRDGRFRLGYVRNPAEEEPDLVLEPKDIKTVTRRATLRPIWRVRIGYAPVEHPIPINSFAGAVTESEVARQSQEYRWVEVIDKGVLALHKAGELEIETRFSNKADAEALAAEVLSLHRKQRDIIEVKLGQKFMRYDIDDIVQVGWARYDLIDDGFILQEDGDRILQEDGDAILKEEDSAGTKFLCVGYVDNPASTDFTLTLWG